MKTPEEYAMLAEQPSTYNELRDLFAACQREAIEVAARWMDEHDRSIGASFGDDIRALLTPTTPARQDEVTDA